MNWRVNTNVLGLLFSPLRFKKNISKYCSQLNHKIYHIMYHPIYPTNVSITFFSYFCVGVLYIVELSPSRDHDLWLLTARVQGGRRRYVAFLTFIRLNILSHTITRYSHIIVQMWLYLVLYAEYFFTYYNRLFTAV